MICLLLAGCLPNDESSLPTLTPPPAITDLPTATIDWFPATATPTKLKPSPESATATPEFYLHGELILKDDFSDETLWQTQNKADAKVSFEPNALSVAISGNGAEAQSISQHILESDFFLEITIEAALCSKGDQYGIIFWRYSDSGTYRLWLNCQGQITVELVTPELTTRLTKWETARKFVPNSPASNVIGIRANNGLLDIFINQSYQFSLHTRNDLKGALGVIARAAGNADLTIRVSDLIISKPEP